jgi:protein-tyrosine-phosphatase
LSLSVPAANRPVRVLFLCTGNSARSILAESLLNHFGGGRFESHSAGSHPKGHVHPLAFTELERMGLPLEGLRSKSWDEFADPDMTSFDYIITVCDNAASETCPVWPGVALKKHWSIADPAAVIGTPAEQELAFQATVSELSERIQAFMETASSASAADACRR